MAEFRFYPDCHREMQGGIRTGSFGFFLGW